jgi:hypothetical protein
VARIRDWLDLGKNTIESLTADDVTGLYVRDWPQTREVLIAEHQDAIARERRRLVRTVRTTSAVFHGLAKRLAPVRRILFLLSCVSFAVCLFAIARHSEVQPWLFVEISGTFVVIVLLLAMELIDKIRFRDELALARELQATLIPKSPPRTETWDIAAFNHIANTVGGDLYDFVPQPDGRIAVLFGDASGHGMAAGLVMAVAHAAFRTQLDIDPSPAAIIASLNRILCRTGGSRSFFACCYLLLSPDGSYSATVAGHPPIVRLDAAGKVAAKIGKGAYPLGIKTNLQWEEAEGTLARGERLLLHSDGLTESRNDAGNELGDASVETVAGWYASAPAGMLVHMLVEEWRKFIGHQPVEDDVSIAVIERL